VLLCAPLLVSACGSDDPTNIPTPPTPVAITEPFTDTLNINGGRTHPFVVQQAGRVTVVLRDLTPDQSVTIGFGLGTWNGVTCTINVRNDAALLNASVVADAQQTGQFCVSAWDVGKLTASTGYTIEVTHF
jgi:hypothetical protein